MTLNIGLNDELQTHWVLIERKTVSNFLKPTNSKDLLGRGYDANTDRFEVYISMDLFLHIKSYLSNNVVERTFQCKKQYCALQSTLTYVSNCLDLAAQLPQLKGIPSWNLCIRESMSIDVIHNISGSLWVPNHLVHLFHGFTNIDWTPGYTFKRIEQITTCNFETLKASLSQNQLKYLT